MRPQGLSRPKQLTPAKEGQVRDVPRYAIAALAETSPQTGPNVAGPKKVQATGMITSSGEQAHSVGLGSGEQSQPLQLGQSATRQDFGQGRPGTSGGSGVQDTILGSEKVKLALVLDQGDDTEIRSLDVAELRSLMVHRKVMINDEENPAPDE